MTCALDRHPAVTTKVQFALLLARSLSSNLVNVYTKPMNVYKSCLHGLLPGPFLLSYSVFVFSFSLFFVSVPCARLIWPSRQLLNARKYTVSYRTKRLRALCDVRSPAYNEVHSCEYHLIFCIKSPKHVDCFCRFLIS